MRSLFIVISSLWLSLTYGAVKGRVIDVHSGESLIGAVIHGGENINTTTDKFGQFELNQEVQNIEVSYLGYVTQKLEVTEQNSSFLMVRMESESQSIGEVVIQSAASDVDVFNSIGSYESMALNDELKPTQLLLNEQLNYTPGIYAHVGALNTSRITVRGIGARTQFGTNRIKAYLDNIPLVSGEGSVELEEINQFFVSKAEIIKGAKSTLFGAGLGGAINMHTLSDYDERIAAQLHLGMGSFGTQRLNLSLYGKEQKLSWQVAFSRTLSDGFRENSQYSRSSGLVKLNYESEKNSLQWTSLAYSMDAGIPSSIDSATFQDNPSAAAANWLAAEGVEENRRFINGFTWKRYINSSWANSFTGFFNYGLGFERTPIPSTPIMEDKALLTGFRNNLKYKKSRLEFDWLTEYYYENFRQRISNQFDGSPTGEPRFRHTEYRYVFNTAVSFRVEMSDDLTVEGGLNLNNTSYEILRKPDGQEHINLEYTYPVTYSPMLGGVYKLDSLFRLFANVSHGMSHPTVEETLFDANYALNDDLKPEQGWMQEIGIRYKLLDGSWYGSLAFYNINVSDLLISRQLDDALSIYENAGKTAHRGIEFQSFYHRAMDHNVWKAFRLMIGYDYQVNEFVEFNNKDGNTLPGLPESKLSTGIHTSLQQGLSLLVNYTFVGDQFINDSNTEYYNSYNLVNLRLTYGLTLKKYYLETYIAANNIFDQHYASMLSVNSRFSRYFYTGAPQNFLLGIKFHIN